MDHKKILISFILVIASLAPCPSYSRSITIPSTLTKWKLGTSIEYFGTQDDALTVNTIAGGEYEHQWKTSSTEAINLGFTDQVIWVRFSLANGTEDRIRFYLEEAYPLLDYVSLFVSKKKGDFQEIETGMKYSFDHRPIRYRTFLFPMELGPREEKACYMRFKNSGPMHVELQVWHPDAFFNNVSVESIFLWMFYGGMLIMMLYNLFLLFTIRESIYFYTIMYIACFSLLMMSLNGLSFQYLWPESLWWAKICLPVLMGIINFSIIQYARHYIQTWNASKLVDAILMVLLIAALSLSLLTIVLGNYHFGIIAATALTGISATAGSIMALVMAFRPGLWVRYVKFFVSAFILFLAGIMLYVLKTFGILPEMFLTTYSIQFGAIMNAALLSIALADKLNVMKNNLQDMNVHLEEKVRERTNELTVANEELESMNEMISETNLRLEDAHRIAQKDMMMAVNVQMSFFPKTPPRTGNWDTAFIIRPMAGVSGDFFDFYITDDTLEGLVLMDVSGHGIASGLLTMIARSIFRRNFYTGRDKKLNEVLEASNRELINEIGKTEMYLTGIMLRFAGDAVEYVNAAHDDILCKGSKSMEVEPLQMKDVDFKGMFLGKAEIEDTYRTVRLIHHRNDSLLLFTDGLTESKNRSRAEFGIDNLALSLKNAPDGSAREILEHIIKDFEQHIADVQPGDDVTAIVLKRL